MQFSALSVTITGLLVGGTVAAYQDVVAYMLPILELVPKHHENNVKAAEALGYSWAPQARKEYEETSKLPLSLIEALRAFVNDGEISHLEAPAPAPAPAGVFAEAPAP